MQQAFFLLALSLFGGVIGIIGGLFFLYHKKWSATLEVWAIPFAAGVLLTVSLFGLIPEALELIGYQAWVLVATAFATALVFERVVLAIHHHAHDHHNLSEHNHAASHSQTSPSAVALVLVGDTIHNLIDGIAIGASFLASPGLGLLTAFSTFLHEIPHEIGDFGVLLKAGWAKKNIIIVNAISALVTVVGAMSVLAFPHNDQVMGTLLAISAGIFLYLGTVDFLPQVIAEARQKKKQKVAFLLPLLLGVVTILATLMLVPHGHEHDEDGSQHLESIHQDEVGESHDDEHDDEHN